MTMTLDGPAPAKPAISDEIVAHYRDHGWAIARNFFSTDQIARVGDSAEALLRRTDLMHTDNIRCRWSTDVNNGACVFETFDPVADLSPECGELALDQRLLAAVSALYGEPAHLFKDKLIFKPPGIKGYAMHQDYISWPGFPKSFMTVLVPIDPSTEENGCTEVFSGYHHLGNMSANDGEYHELQLDRIDLSRGVKMELAPGDVGFFSGFTPHRSAPNRSGRYRKQLYLSYNADSDGGDQRAAHYAEFHVWLRKKYAEYGKHNVYFR